MPVTDQDARALAYLATRIRPYGARRWDEPGILAAIAKVKTLNLADVALAVVHAADDRSLETPAAIGNPKSPCWRERNPDRPAERKPYVPQQTCDICGFAKDDCEARWAEDHEFTPVPAARDRALPKEQAVEVVTELKNHLQPLRTTADQGHDTTTKEQA